MLAYVFWHRPRDGADKAAYELRLQAFHRSLDVTSASFSVGALPFAEGAGYEDWYLVPSWHELGELNRAAISGRQRAPHAAVAEVAGEGWGAVYALLRGEQRPPMAVRWMGKPSGGAYDLFLGSLQAPTVWQRQLLLGPAPEFCAVDESETPPTGTSRVPVYWVPQ